MDPIPEVQDATSVTNAEFVKLKIFNEYQPNTAGNVFANSTYQIAVSGNTNWTSIGASSNAVGTVFTANNTGSGNGTAYDISIYTFSSAYTEETINGYEYDPLGGLLAVGAQNRELRVTAGDTSISLSGVGGNNITTVLGKKIRGSEIEILRGFYNNNMVLTNSYPRFTGIVTGYSIQEDREDKDDTFTVVLNASSYKTVLENRIAGRKTNQESWQTFNPTDTSMNQVYSIAGVQFDFGQDPKGKTTVPGYTTPGGGGGFGPGFDFDVNRN